MCGRLDQNHTAVEYVAAMHWPHRMPLFASQAVPTMDACPGTYRPLLHAHDGQLLVDDLHWGYRAHWAADKLPVAINARIEKLGGRYWRPLLAKGRAIVPASGWYEWTGEKGKRQRWHIHLRGHGPMFIAALANFGPFREHAAESGFAIVTLDAAGGMVDVHDRRPVVLSPRDAALWLDPELSPEQAEQLARAMTLPGEAFDWYMVDKNLEPGKAGVDAEAAPAAAPAQLDLPLG